MIDRQRLETILSRRFPGATLEQIATAANAIMGIGNEWQEVPRADLGRLARTARTDADFRVFRRVADGDAG
jgi:hypothetical protein